MFLRYLKHRFPIICLWVLVCMIFAIVFGLYELPMAAVFYPTILSMVLWILFFCADYFLLHKKHRNLDKILQEDFETMEELPDTFNLVEEDYQKIITSLQEQLNDLVQKDSTKYREMIDYYTLWVHQIKTPIASMKLTLQKEDSAVARKLSSDLFRIEQYVEMVLAYLRLGSDYSDLVLRKIELDECIKSSLKKYASDFIGRKIRLEYEETGLSPITDEKWFSFVLEQLLSNALKYTKEGGSVKIYAKEQCLIVEDTGIGIATEDLPRIFEKGFTGYNGRQERHSSGLGLYLCKQICDKMNIGIKVESKVDVGTKIRLELEQFDGRLE